MYGAAFVDRATCTFTILPLCIVVGPALAYSKLFSFAMLWGFRPPHVVFRRLGCTRPRGRCGQGPGGPTIHNSSTLQCLGAGSHRLPPRRVLRPLAGATPSSNLRTATIVQDDRAVGTMTYLPSSKVFGLACSCYLEVVFFGGWMAHAQPPDLCTAAAVKTRRPEYSQFFNFAIF